MAQTIQSITHRLVEEAKIQYAVSSLNSAHLKKSETKNNLGLMVSMFFELNNLCAELNALDRTLRKNLIDLKDRLTEGE